MSRDKHGASAGGGERRAASLGSLAGGVGLVFLVLCRNAWGCCCRADGAEPRVEHARAALGACRRRMIRQVVVESGLVECEHSVYVNRQLNFRHYGFTVGS